VFILRGKQATAKIIHSQPDHEQPLQLATDGSENTTLEERLLVIPE